LPVQSSQVARVRVSGLKPRDKIMIYSARKKGPVEKTVARVHMYDNCCKVWTTDNMLKPHNLPADGYVDVPK
jgi:hypothetical protein